MILNSATLLNSPQIFYLGTTSFLNLDAQITHQS